MERNINYEFKRIGIIFTNVDKYYLLILFRLKLLFPALNTFILDLRQVFKKNRSFMHLGENFILCNLKRQQPYVARRWESSS